MADVSKEWARQRISSLCAPWLGQRDAADLYVFVNAALEETWQGLGDPATSRDRFGELLTELSLLVAGLATFVAGDPAKTNMTPAEVIQSMWSFSDSWASADPLARAAVEDRLRRGLPLT